MTDKPEALRLADRLERRSMVNAAAELRRLHVENETLRRMLQRAVYFEKATRLPHWATPAWVIESIEELAKAEGNQP